MSNTKTLVNVLASGTTAVIYLTLASDGTQETNYVVYDSSVIATALKIADPLTCTLVSVKSCSTSPVGKCVLRWDATTPILAWTLPYAGSSPMDMDFRPIGGLKNQGGSGITGDITLTTTGLASGDSLALVLIVRVN